MQDLPEQQAREILASLEASEPGIAEQVRVLSSYGEQTAGGIMTTDYLALWPELTVSEAIDEVRRSSHERNLETVYYIYVVAYDKLIGVLSLRDLLLNEGDRTISSVMTSNVVNVGPETDQEEVAAAIARYDLSAIPVVDQQGRMLGVVTVDDVVDVVIEEATEDAHKMAAVMPVEEGYFDTGFVAYFQSRIVWLVVLFVCGLLTTYVMNHYQGELAAAMDLIIFVPLIISSGGNSGSQSSSLIIRALALGELKPADWQRVFGRELLMGLCLGLVLGMVGFARAVMTGGVQSPTALGCTVALSVVAVVTLGTLVGSLMPLVIERLGLDPAVSSTPFVASVVDVLGLMLYFSVAHTLFAALL
jgi:magnesium transporter